MKKLILSVMACAICTLSYAQKGSMELGGSLGISNTTEDYNSLEKSEVFSVSVLPSFMYYISDNVAVGSGIGFSYEKDKSNDIKTSLFQIVPTVRYKIPIIPTFAYTPEFYLGLGFGSYKYRNNSSEDITAFSVGLKVVRFEYRITPKINLSFSCGNLGYSKMDFDNIYENEEYGLGLNLEPTLGFSFVF